MRRHNTNTIQYDRTKRVSECGQLNLADITRNKKI